MRNNASNARSSTKGSSFSRIADDNVPGFLEKDGRVAGFDRYARNRQFKDRDNRRRFGRLDRRNAGGRHDDEGFED